jgi:hypothetical protein
MSVTEWVQGSGFSDQDAKEAVGAKKRQGKIRRHWKTERYNGGSSVGDFSSLKHGGRRKGSRCL